jgi:fumarate hydratase class I
MADFNFAEVFESGPDETAYRKLDVDGISSVPLGDEHLLKVEPVVLEQLAFEAFRDCQHLLRASHLQQLRDILDDAEASDNDRYVAFTMLKNAVIAAAGVLPMCQDTGTAIVMGKRGGHVLTDGDDARHLSRGIWRTYQECNLRFSQVSPLDMFKEKNTGTNLPAQIDLLATKGSQYDFLFMAKGGGSANKTFLYQQTKALLNPEGLTKFLDEKIRTLGTAACPPYHLAIVIGGTSAEATLKTLKLATARYYDGLPTAGGELGQAFRDREWEKRVLRMTQEMGIGAQFGGKYFCHDVRVIRLPRHGASCPVAIGVSCSADRQVLGRISADGVFLEALERDPARFLPDVDFASAAGETVAIDLGRPMAEIRAELSRHPIKTRVLLSGPMIVARDIAHARLKEELDGGKSLPGYFRDHPVYYAGPAKTPTGMASGAFGPTTSARMDPYVNEFQAAGASMVMVGKGNRSAAVRESCKQHGGFYLGSIGGAAADLAQNAIKGVEVVAFSELGMEAVWKIEVEDFPAFIIMDDKGNDFFAGF